ncbi:hypothetical protein PoB_005566300 [Plakobranchus ocellatus]|uniref:Uncharacterized protein n=1 Tax=Plakobranchus ocellatus TaxID=259542 RepID=A0AAV4CDX1_9GAST|nr:hypothetical protein PoB_005566300 [Plakobranchus ocellatus]
MLKYCDDIERAPVSHDCEKCKAPLSDEEVYLIDEIPNMMETISKDEKPITGIQFDSKRRGQLAVMRCEIGPYPARLYCGLNGLCNQRA